MTGPKTDTQIRRARGRQREILSRVIAHAATARRRLHVAVTRAEWQLWLVSGLNRSKILTPLEA